MKQNEDGQYISDDGRWIWDGEAWQSAEPIVLDGAMSVEYGSPAVEATMTAPTSSLTTTCYEQDCQEKPLDFVRLALQAPMGAMTVEVLLCQMHIANLEMMNSGTYLYIRPRERLDLNGR